MPHRDRRGGTIATAAGVLPGALTTLPSPLTAPAVPLSTLPWVFGCALVFLALCGVAWRFALEGDALGSWSRRTLLGSCAALLVLSLAVRLALATTVLGVPTDIACFKAWPTAFSTYM